MTQPIFICRRHIDVNSGAGQMIASQAVYFQELGHPVTVSCEKLGKGARQALPGCNVQYLSKLARVALPTSVRRRIYASRMLDFRRANDGVVIDHGQSIREADLNYVHNFMVPYFASRMPTYLRSENNGREHWSAISDGSIVIANSHLVRQGIIDQFAVAEGNVKVIYPGYCAERFRPEQRKIRRAEARQQLGVDHDAPLIGMVTSGQFVKRGLRVFLDTVDEVRSQIPGIRAMVVGGRTEPRLLSAHPARQSGEIIYRPSTAEPETYFAALDVFLYPARYEEFGIVVLEAMAMGIPVITSTAVGASELLAAVDRDFVIEAPGDNEYAYGERVMQVLDMPGERRKALAAAFAEFARGYTHEKHNAAAHALLS